MKTVIVAIFAVLLFSVSAFAANDVEGTGSLAPGGGAMVVGTAPVLTIGLSPKVYGRYVTDGTTETSAQWYAISTVHPGGNVGYGTAQDVNNIYMKAFVTGDLTDTITDAIQTTKTPAGESTDTSTGVVTPAQATWTAGGWSLTAPVQ